MLAAVSARAQLVDAYFPPGVTGYQAGPGVTVASRARPEYDPPGVRLGPLLLHPTLSEALGYDSNPTGTGAARPGVLAAQRAALQAATTWSRDNVSAYVSLDDARYPALPSQSFTNWTVSLGQQIDLGRDRLTLAAAHLALHQSARDLNVPLLDHPGAYTVDDLRAAFATRRGPWRLEPGLEFIAYRYGAVTSGGRPLSQRGRDRNLLQGSLATRWGNAALRDLVVVVRVANTHYLHGQIGQPAADSTSIAVLGGLDHAGGVWRTRALLGYQLRQFASSAYKAEAAPVLEAGLTWSPTGLTTAGLTLTRRIEDQAAEGAAGYVLNEGRLALDHELQRDVLLGAYVDLQRAEYPAGNGQATAGHETVASAGGSATWLIDRHLRLVGSYDHFDKRSTLASSLTEDTVLLRLVFGL